MEVEECYDTNTVIFNLNCQKDSQRCFRLSIRNAYQYFSIVPDVFDCRLLNLVPAAVPPPAREVHVRL